MDLSSTIDYYQKQLKSTLSLHDIEKKTFILHLDYVDLTNLCRANKAFNVCNDEMLKYRLSINLGIIFPKNMNVAKLMRELDHKIVKFIHLHYTLPSWVNTELFMIDRKKKIYNNLAERFVNELEGYFLPDKTIDQDFYNNKSVPLSNHLTAFVIVSDQYVEPDYDDEIEIHENKITLSKSFVKYLMYGIGNNRDYHDLIKIVNYLLFID